MQPENTSKKRKIHSHEMNVNENGKTKPNKKDEKKIERLWWIASVLVNICGFQRLIGSFNPSVHRARNTSQCKSVPAKNDTSNFVSFHKNFQQEVQCKPNLLSADFAVAAINSFAISLSLSPSRFICQYGLGNFLHLNGKCFECGWLMNTNFQMQPIYNCFAATKRMKFSH